MSANLHIISKFMVWLIPIFFIVNLITYQPYTEGVIKTTFSDGSSFIDLIFPTGGEINDSINISILNGTAITSANFKINADKYSGEYPTNLYLDIGRDGDYDWSFNGPGYGSMGYQTLFNNSQSYLWKQFTGISGEKISNNILIPKDIEIKSASISVSGQLAEFSQKTVLDSNLGMTYNSELADIDGDNDLDAVITFYQTSPAGYKISWLENTVGDGTSWTKHDLPNSALLQPYALGVADLDGDNDQDIISADNTLNAKAIYWYNNTNGLGTSWTRHTVEVPISTTSGTYIYSLAIADINKDTFNDIVATLYNTDSSDDIFWYSNINGDGTSWYKTVMNTTQDGVRFVKLADMDNDNDYDAVTIINQVSGTDEIVWYCNEDSIGGSWTAYSVDSSITDPYAVTIGDFDLDSNVDIATIAQSSSYWYEAPNDPRVTSWTRRTVGVGGGNLGGDISVIDLGYNHTGKEPDNNLDIAIVSRTSNDVLIYKNDGTPLNGGWGANYLDYNNLYVNFVDVGDIDGDTYSDVLTSSSTTSTTDDAVWYKLTGGFPADVELDIGSDSQPDWVNPGSLSSNIQIPDLKNNLTQYLSQSSGFLDDHGNYMVPIKLRLTSSKAGIVSINQLKIEYNYTALVSKKPNGDLAEELTEALNKIAPGPDGNCTIPFRFSSTSAGKIRIKDLNIEFNKYPWFSKPLPQRLLLPEDSKDLRLLDLTTYLADDYLDPKDLNYTISYITGPGKDKVILGIYDDYYFGADAFVGPDNNNWTGNVQFKIKITDNYGLQTQSELITLEITPVNDEPVPGYKFYKNIKFLEGGSSDPIDLDSQEYFKDVDHDPLYFKLKIDPSDIIKGENISYSIDTDTNQIILSSTDDWYGDNVSVFVFCDDSLPVNDTLYKTFKVSVQNQNDQPVWSDIPDMTFDEDQIVVDYLNLKDYVIDLDDAFENLSFSVTSNSKSEFLSVNIDPNGNLDIVPLKPEFTGSADITLRAMDPGLQYSDETFQITFNEVDDSPTVELLTPRDNTVVPSGTVIITWHGMDIDTPLENLIYTIYLSDTPSPAQKETNIKGNQYIAEDLVNSKIYYCQIKVSDGASYGYSDLIQFLIDLEKQPNVKLLAPKKDSIITSSDTVLFEWEIIEDNDLDLFFDFYLDTDANPLLEGLYATGLTKTNFLINDKKLELNVTYYWTVIPRFDTGYGKTDDGVWKFSIDPSKITYGLEISSTVDLIEILQGEQNTFNVDIKNTGLFEEEIKVEVLPDNINKNLQRDIRTPTINLVSGGGKTIKFTLDTTNFYPGEYNFTIEATSIETPAYAEKEFILNVKKEETTEKEDQLFSDYLSWLPIILILVIGLILAVIISRYKSKEPELDTSFESELHRKLVEDIPMPDSELMLGPPEEYIGPVMGFELGLGPPSEPSSGPGAGGTGTITAIGPLPKLPPGTQQQDLEFRPEPETYVPPPEPGADEEFLDVMLPPEVELPEQEVNQDHISETTSTKTSTSSGPHFGESLQLDTIDEDENENVDKDKRIADNTDNAEKNGAQSVNDLEIMLPDDTEDEYSAEKDITKSHEKKRNG